MYANLRVELVTGEDLYAHNVTFPKNGRVLIHLDDPTDQSDYWAPCGLRSLEPREIARIAADW